MTIRRKRSNRVRRDHPSSEPFDREFTKADLAEFAKTRRSPTDIRFYVIIDKYRGDIYVVRWFDRARDGWRAERIHRPYQDAMSWAFRKARRQDEKLYGRIYRLPSDRSHTVLARF
jgi:hypothetical protein